MCRQAAGDIWVISATALALPLASHFVSRCHPITPYPGKKQSNRTASLHGVISGCSDGTKGWIPLREYQKQAQRLLTRFGQGADLSRMDWMIATDMAKSGRFTVQDIATATA